MGLEKIKAIVELIKDSSIKSFDIWKNSNTKPEGLIGTEGLIMLVNSLVPELIVKDEHLEDEAAIRSSSTSKG